MASRSTNKAAVPEAKGALDKFKYEVAKDPAAQTAAARMQRQSARPAATALCWACQCAMTPRN